MNDINMLVRGVPRKIHMVMQKIANEQNLSVNQLLVRAIMDYVKKMEKQREEEERTSQAIRRINEIREEIYHQFGRSEDSAKIIREMREERTRRIMGE